MIVQHRLTVPTHGRGTYDITAQVQGVVRGAGIAIGLCHVFCHQVRSMGSVLASLHAKQRRGQYIAGGRS